MSALLADTPEAILPGTAIRKARAQGLPFAASGWRAHGLKWAQD
jgi:hypothetical protein